MQEDNPGDEKPGWSFNPDSQSTEAGSQGSSGLSDIEWTASEYIAHHHGFGWYFLLALGSLALTALVYWLTKSIFSAGVIPVLAIIVGIFAARAPKSVSYAISSDGIEIAGRFYDYHMFKSFSIIDEGGIPSITLLPLKRFMPPISAYFAPEQIDSITTVLGNYLPFEQRQPDFTERLTHRLRF